MSRAEGGAIRTEINEILNRLMMALFRFLRHGSSFPWRATTILGAHAHGGARGLSYVPVDDVVSGLTEDQIQVKYCVIPYTCI